MYHRFRFNWADWRQSRGGRPLGFGRQLSPQLTVGRRPLGGGGGGHWRGGFRDLI